MKITDEAVGAAANDHRLTVDGTCTCGFASHKVRYVRIHITKAQSASTVPEAVIEAGAEAAWSAENSESVVTWAELDPFAQSIWRNRARAAIEAALPDLGSPE